MNQPIRRMIDPDRCASSVHQGELRTHWLTPLLMLLYRFGKGHKRRKVASFVFNLIRRLEGGGWRSETIRKCLRRDYHVDIGPYSYGDAMIPGAFPPSVIVGRYVSIGPGVRVFTQNHPLDRLSTHPYFYDPRLGVVEQEQLEPGLLEIGHDVWLGQNAIVLPGCRRIGISAVIGAGAVVTRDVPDFAIVGGCPAKVLRYRFDEPTQQKLLNSQWWNQPIEALKDYRRDLALPLTELPDDHPLLRTAMEPENEVAR